MSDTQPQPPGRRDFFRTVATVVVGAVVGAVPFAAGLFVMLDPLRRKSRGPGKFLPVAPLASLPVGGHPQFYKVYDELVDAWTRQAHVAIGNVYLRRVAEKKVEAFNATCPHLGCLIGETPQGAFLCPCHNSRFTPDGHIDRSGGGVVPSPRDMDSLEVKIETINGTEMVLVKFQNFITANPRKIPIA